VYGFFNYPVHFPAFARQVHKLFVEVSPEAKKGMISKIWAGFVKANLNFAPSLLVQHLHFCFAMQELRGNVGKLLLFSPSRHLMEARLFIL
jgi:hypothetical protein